MIYIIKGAIFCQIEHDAMVKVIEQFKKIPEIKRIMSLTGDYDVLAEIETETTDELYDAFANKIDKIEGIINTNTHIIMKEWTK